MECYLRFMELCMVLVILCVHGRRESDDLVVKEAIWASFQTTLSCIGDKYYRYHLESRG